MIDEDPISNLRRYDARWLGREVVAVEFSDTHAADPECDELFGIAPSLLRLPAGGKGHTPRLGIVLSRTARGEWIRSTAADVAKASEELVRSLLLVGRLRPLLRTIKRLHSRKKVWLDFDPAEVVSAWDEPDGLRLLNLVGRSHPAGTIPARLRISPYSAPEVVHFQASAITSATDVFHIGALLYSLAAGRYPLVAAPTDRESTAQRFPPIRTFRPQLPPGLDPILRKAMAAAPRDRFATVDELGSALDSWGDEIQRRARPVACQFAWDGDTLIGTVKATLCPENQDRVHPERGERRNMLTEDDPFGLVAVADGVSTCRIGSGAVASRLTIEAVKHAHDRIVSQASDVVDPVGAPGRVDLPTARQILEELPGRATRAIIHAVKELPEGSSDIRGIMTSTLVAAWIDRSRALIASVGDSRCYLITSCSYEQLTRDDDVETLCIADGSPPGEVAELPDLERKALRKLVGAARVNGEGQVEPDVERVTPTVLEIGLLPGDTLLLCSDGLVEDGLFLGAHEAAEMIRAGSSDPINQVVDRLLAAADARQRLPKNGDNISCVLVRVLPTIETGHANA